MERISKLVWLLRNAPKPPMATADEALYNFQELFEFEAGFRKLNININWKNFDIKKIHDYNSGSNNFFTYKTACTTDAGITVRTEELEHEGPNRSFKPAYIMSQQEEKHHCESQNIKKSLIYGYQSFKDRLGQVRKFTETTFETIGRLFKDLDVSCSADVPIKIRVEYR